VEGLRPIYGKAGEGWAFWLFSPGPFKNPEAKAREQDRPDA